MGEGAGCDEGNGEEVEEVRGEEGGKGVEVVDLGVFGGAERAAGHDIGPVLEVEQAGFHVYEAGAEGLVGRG